MQGWGIHPGFALVLEGEPINHSQDPRGEHRQEGQTLLSSRPLPCPARRGCLGFHHVVLPQLPALQTQPSALCASWEIAIFIHLMPFDAIFMPFLCHLKAIFMLFLCHFNAILMPLKCHFMPFLCHLKAIFMLFLCHFYTILMPF